MICLQRERFYRQCLKTTWRRYVIMLEYHYLLLYCCCFLFFVFTYILRVTAFSRIQKKNILCAFQITVKMIDHAIKSFDANLRQRNEFSELEPRYIGNKALSNKISVFC